MAIEIRNATLVLLTIIFAFGNDVLRADKERRLPFEWFIPGIVQDENGERVIGAVVETMPIHGPIQSSVSDTNGKFVLSFRSSNQYSRSLMIRSDDGNHKSFVPHVEHESRELLKVILKPTRTVTVRVVDGKHEPLTGATVGVFASYKFIATAKSNANGSVTFQLPADAEIDWITAHHNEFGFDYYENYDSYPVGQRLVPPRDLQLILDGESDATVKVVDTDGKPISDVEVVPWIVHKKGKLSHANIGGMTGGKKSDASGIVKLTWLPPELERRVSISVRHPKYHCPKTPGFPSGEMPMVATMLRRATLRGTVRHEDGSPAEGIHLQGEGRGNTNHYFRGHTMTGADGTYEIDIYPDQSTILAVTESAWAAKSHTGIKLTEGKAMDGLDFVINNGTLIRGTVTIGPDAKPLFGDTVTLIQKSDGTDLVRWAKTDKKGTYRFRVGAGTYSLHLPNQPWEKAIPLNIAAQTEIVHDGHTLRKDRVTLSGTAVSTDEKPLKGCVVYGESIGAVGHAGFRSKTDASGKFSTERWSDQMFLYAINENRNLAGFKRIREDDATVRLKLAPAATASGRVSDQNGNPVANVRVQLMIGRPPDLSLNLFVQSDRDGEYEFRGIAPGVHCDIQCYLGQQNTKGPSFEVRDAKPVRIDDTIVTVVGPD